MRAALAVIMVAVLWFCQAPQVFAHAALLTSEPADGAVVAGPPGRFSLTFNEPVTVFALRLVMPDGQPVSLAPLHTLENAIMAPAPPQLQDGTYLLSWRVVSLDGHPIGGTLTFSIGKEGPLPVADTGRATGLDLAVWISRLTLYAFVFFGIGGVFIQSWLARGPLPPPIRPWLVSCLLLTPAAAALSLGLLGLDALEAPWRAIADAETWTAGLATTYGRTAGLVTLAALLALAAMNFTPRALSALALATAGLAFAASGHAASAPPYWLTRPAIVIHTACLAVWLGSLPPLLALYWSKHPDRTSVLRQFSALISMPLAALVLTGGTLAVVQIPQVSQIWQTPYGLVLCLKLALVVALLGLAAYNRFSLTPKLFGGGRQADKALVRSIALEIGIAIAILGSVALWRFTPPPRTIDAPLPAIELHMHGSEAMALASIAPGRKGNNEFAITLLDLKESPLEAEAVRVTLVSTATAIEPIRREAAKDGSGGWRAELYLPVAGSWQLRLDIRVGTFKSMRLEGEFTLRP